MAAADTFHLTVAGRGGHGAMPHLSTDPVVAAAAVITALQPLVSRETSPTDGAVVTVATINTGALPLRTRLLPVKAQLQPSHMHAKQATTTADARR